MSKRKLEIDWIKFRSKVMIPYVLPVKTELDNNGNPFCSPKICPIFAESAVMNMCFCSV